MRKRMQFYTAIILFNLAFLFQASAQSSAVSGPQVATNIHESIVGYQKTQQPATVLEYPYDPDLVEDLIKDYMAGKGYKGSGSRGYTVFRNVRLDNDGKDINDLHVKVERKSREEKGTSVVTVLTVAPNEDPAKRVVKDTLAMARAQAFFERMTPAIVAGELENRIKTQGKDTKKSQDKLTDLRDDQVSLEKKIRNAQADLEKNRTDQLKETKQMQESVDSNDPKATKKSHKRMERLLNDQVDLQKKIEKYQTSLTQNMKDQGLQESQTNLQQQKLDSLKSERKNP